jgi:DNA repair photolyase
LLDLRQALLDLLAPASIGDELIPGLRLLGASTELGLRVSFSRGDELFQVDVAPIEESRRSAAASARFSFGYVASGGAGNPDAALGLELCRAVARAARANEQAVLERLARAVEEQQDGSRVREVRVEQLLEPAGQGAGRYYTLSPYVGCLIGCRFCYAQSKTETVRRLLRLPPAPWGSYVDVRLNAAEVLQRELAELAPRPIKFCPIVSDPYQAVDKRYELTRRCVEVIAARREPPPVMVLTRSRGIERDADLLASLPRAFVGMSIPTLDDEVRRHFEPRAASIPERLALLAGFAGRGVRTFAVVQPMLPGSVLGLAEALAACVSSVSIDVLHGTYGAETDFADERYAEAREEGWQRERAEELARELRARGVGVWAGELPAGIEPT